MHAVHRPDRGEIEVDGGPCHFAGPRAAIAAGIVRRTIPGLYEVQTDSISLKLACRLLADGKIDRARLDELDEALANSGQNCTIAPPVAIPTR